jgi:hypothetical protein
MLNIDTCGIIKAQNRRSGGAGNTPEHGQPLKEVDVPNIPHDKVCCKCGILKPSSEFYRNKYKASGLHSMCRPCQRAYDAALANRAVVVADSRTCTRCGIEKPASDFLRTNRNRSGLTSWCKLCGNASARARRAKDPEKLKRQQQENRNRHHEKLNQNQKTRGSRLREAVIERLGGPRCRACGYDADVRALQIDHIHGDGWIDRQRFGASSTPKYYLALSRLDDMTLHLNYQILCANCNTIKRFEEKEDVRHFTKRQAKKR